MSFIQDLKPVHQNQLLMEGQYTNDQVPEESQNGVSTQFQQESTVQVQPLYMWTQGQDQQWQMMQYYAYYFDGLLQAIAVLRTTVNQKWRQQQVDAYLKYLDDVQNYIRYYIYTQVVYDFNVFLDAMTFYGDLTNPIGNPVGKQLYETQIDFLQKVQSGYDFKLDKKKKKKDVKQVQTKQPVKLIVQKKQQAVIRKNDPEINIQTLMSTNWPEDKYVNINLFKKENVNIVFIGHVDAGKSTLTGNILKQLGEVDEQQLARNKQQAKQNKMESFELAGIADVDPSERKRGKTVEYAKLNFSLEKRRFTVFDAPGHKNYVPNMIMGACQADIAVLIISSKEGEFQSGFQKDGQTKQHAMLARALGVSGFLVVVTKMSTHDWSQNRFDHIKEQVTPFLQNACGFQKINFIPLDSINNLNIHKPLEGSWYKGPCLLDYLNTTVLPERKPLSPLRIPVIDKFRQVGNLYLYGKVQSGTIIEDQTITILPSRKQAIIKQIFNAKDERLPFAMAGQNVKMKMKGIQDYDTKRGDILCNNQNYCQQTYQFKATVNVLQLPDTKKLMSSGYECVLHMHAISEQVEIFKVEAKFDTQNKKFVNATFLKAGQQGSVTIRCSNILCLQKYQFMASLGRFTLRDEGKTVGYGFVTKIRPAKTLLEEQRSQVGAKKQTEEAKLSTKLENLTVNN